MTATYSALRAHEQRITGMYADPQCVGELLLVGQAMARSVDLADPPWGDTGSMPMGVIADRVYGPHWAPGPMLIPGTHRGDPHPRKRIRSVFYADRRRYDPDAGHDRPHWAVLCGRPMVRRDGLCGKPASDRRRVTDPATGLRSWVGACTQKPCKAWLSGLLARNRADCAATPPPVPAANAGGVLERHLPEIDWWAVWRAVDSRWVPPPEGRPFEKPTLTLIVGDDAAAGPVPVGRPVLQVLVGGWR